MMSTPKQIRLKTGDLFYVPLDEHLGAVGIVLHVSRVFKDGILVGFYDKSFGSPGEVDLPALDKFLETPNYTLRRLVTSDHWTWLGNSPELLAQAAIPRLRVAYDLYFEDKIVGKVEFHEFRDYTELGLQGGLFIENKLRGFFQADSSRPNTPDI